jgi:hypothetical protein
MPDVVSDDELNALAAEYVLGTLDYEERKGAAALLEVDPGFQGIVRIWERRFGDLYLMVEAVEPDAQLWERIRPKVGGIEQDALAIPSHADAQAAATTTEEPAVETPSVSPEAEAVSPAADVAVEAPKVDAAPVDSPAPTTEAPAGEPKPTEAVPPAIAETERKLAELAALLPSAESTSTGETEAKTDAKTDDAKSDSKPDTKTDSKPESLTQPLPEDGLHTHAPDLVPRGFVPPAPMSTRGAPTVVEVPVRETGRGWVAATVAMGLVSLVLAGLIGAWRYFPERLPASLRAYSVLNLSTSPQTPAAKARPQLAPFDE